MIITTKPCPHCAGVKIEESGLGFLVCENCGATGPLTPGPFGDDQLVAWETRKAPMVELIEIEPIEVEPIKVKPSGYAHGL
jgi:hypothetical protein